MPYKGFATDMHPTLQPEGTYRYAMNKLLHLDGTVSDEPGTSILKDQNGFAIDPYCEDAHTWIGETSFPDGSLCVFFNNLDTETANIWLLNSNGTSQLVLYNVRDFLFNENAEFKARGFLNEEGHRLVLWTDGGTPYLFNIDGDDPVVPVTTQDDLDKLKLFPDLSVPIIDSLTVNDSGGALKTGTYQLAFCYNYDDFNKTDYLLVSNRINIVASTLIQEYSKFTGSDGGILSSKSVTVELSGLDLKFKKFTLAVIKTIEGVISAEEVTSYPITSDSTTITYTGSEKSSAILLEDITVPKNIFNTVKTFALTNKYLALGNLGINNLPDYQSYANAITTKWVYDFEDTQVGINGTTGTYKDGTVSFKLRSYMPGEVYAFYIAFRLNDGRRSPFYHIPGRTSIILEDDHFGLNGEYEYVKLSEAEGANVGELIDDQEINPDIKWFHTRSTARSEGQKMGYWENEEVYPSTFPALAGQKVRHHKFPDITDLENWYYPYLTWETAGSNAGKLGVMFELDGDVPEWNLFTHYSNFESVTIEYGTLATGYKIIYGTTSTSMLHVTATFSNVAFNTDYFIYKVSGATTTTLDHKVIMAAMGGAILTSEITESFASGDYIYFFVDPKSCDVSIEVTLAEYDNIEGLTRGTPLGIEFSNIVVPQTINGESFLNQVQGYEIYYAKRTLSNSTVVTQGFLFGIEDDTYKAIPGEVNINWCFHSSDLLNNESYPSVQPDFAKVQRFVKNFDYFRWQEGKVGTQINVEPENLIRRLYDSKYVPQNLERRTESRLEGKILTPLPELGVAGNFTSSQAHISLCSYRTNAYSNFNTQELINTGYYFPISQFGYGAYATGPIYGGDTFINEDSFLVPDYVEEDTPPCSGYNIYSHIFHTSLPACLRQIGEQDYETFYPYTTAAEFDALELPEGVSLCDLDNFVKINEDYAKLNDTIQLLPPLEKYLGEKSYPNDIAYSVISNANTASIRNFLPNNYYSMPAHKGVIINLEGYSNDLYIHTPLGLFKTITQVKMKSNEEDVIMGSPDLFEVEPQDIALSEKGYGGTKAMSACLMTQFGYVWVDSGTGKVFMLTDKLEEISNLGNSKLLEWKLQFNHAIQLGAASRYFIAYDPEFKRIMFAKKEFGYGGIDELFVTYSFSTHSRLWESEHSLYPSAYFSNQNNLLSISGGNIYKHDSLVTPCLFYTGARKESFIDIAIPLRGYSITSLVRWLSKAVGLNGHIDPTITFDKIAIYNQNQLSKTITLDLTQMGAGQNCFYNKGYYSFNQLFDYLLSGEYSVNGNYELNGAVANRVKNWYDQKRFIGGHIVVRLYSNNENYNVYLHDVIADSRPFYM